MIMSALSVYRLPIRALTVLIAIAFGLPTTGKVF